MSIKVLVFESDAAFASELRSELGKLGCSTCVVDDGSVGLQQASAEKPDLILLSIELPRMNGFSVCNKLKKDPGLKEVPLIIMSSESSDETFEQHRKLRTRAEDYVHKPIAFGELLGHIQSFVQLGAAAQKMADTDGIVIDEEIAIQNIDDDEGTQIAMRPDFGELRKRVDPEVDSFTDAAFGRLTGNDAPPTEQPQTKDFNGTGEHASPQTRPGAPAPAPSGGARRPPSARPVANDGELDRLRSDLERAAQHASDLETQLGQANEQLNRVNQEHDAEVERLQRDVDELRTRTSIPVKAAAGVSSREFLDLREALNKKDKEILSLKTQLTTKDKEIFEARDKSLALERLQSELDDKVLAKDREAAEVADKLDDLAAQLDGTSRTLGEQRARATKLEGEVSAKNAELSQLASRHEADKAALEAAAAALKDEHQNALRTLKGEQESAVTALRAEHAKLLEKADLKHASELEEAETQREAELEEARQDREAALAQAAEAAAKDRAGAVAAREAELRAETESKLAALHRAQQDELAKARAEAADRLSARERELDAKIEAALTELADWKQKKSEADAAKQNSDAANEARIASLNQTLAQTNAAKEGLEAELASARDRIATIEVDLSALRGDLSDTKSKLDAELTRANRAYEKWEADRTSLERAKDALAVALAQLDEAEARPIGG